MHKTLWALEYGNEKVGVLLFLYARDEKEAWKEVTEWAIERDITLPPEATIKHYPNGFQLNIQTLPGTIQEM